MEVEKLESNCIFLKIQKISRPFKVTASRTIYSVLRVKIKKAFVRVIDFLL